MDSKRELRHNTWDYGGPTEGGQHCRHHADHDGDHDQQIQAKEEKGVGGKVNWNLKGFENCPICCEQYQRGQALVELQCGVSLLSVAGEGVPSMVGWDWELGQKKS